MPKTRGGLAAILLGFLAPWGALPLLAQPEDPLAVGRKMLAEDNPGELWIERGKALFHQKRGPKGVSLEGAISASGRASSKALPRNCRATFPTSTGYTTWNPGCCTAWSRCRVSIAMTS